MFTSDHGYFYGEHGLNEERRLAHEETIRIPLLIRYPRRVAANVTRSQMVLSIDLAPTLLELAGVQPGADLQGRSLIPVLERDSRDWRSSFLVELSTATPSSRAFTRWATPPHGQSATSYIQYRELEGMDELYDLEADPFEETNIIGRPDASGTLERMKSELRRLLEQTK